MLSFFLLPGKIDYAIKALDKGETKLERLTVVAKSNFSF